ncbi:MAG: glycosyltransferase [Lachnospiraceae bacterium]|nr:glycosyltransferase [Lachnospiraceae bacterium]
MSGRTKCYDWAAYYETAYETERRNNSTLAGKIGDSQRRQEDLNDNLNRIYASLFWRMTSPFRGLYHTFKGERQRTADIDRGSGADSCLLRYEEEMRRQEWPYAEWILQENNNSYINDNRSSVTVNGWKVIDIPQTEIVILACGRGIINNKCLDEIKSYFNKNVSCKIAYTDEDFYWEDLSGRMQPWFKPCYSPDTLLAYNCWGHLVAVKKEFLIETRFSVESMKTEEREKFSVRFYDLCLRLEEAVCRRCRLESVPPIQAICHIDGVLYHRRYEPSVEIRQRLEACEDKEEQLRIVRQCLQTELENGCYLEGAGADCMDVREQALARRGVKAVLMSAGEPDLYHVVYDTSISGRERCVRAQNEDRQIPPHYMVSVVIPSKDHPEVLERCLKSFREKTDYPYYEWIVVDNGSSDENRAKIERLRRKYGFTYLYESMPFNFSKMCNMGAAQAVGDLILLLNDDVEIIERSWLRRMTGQALQPHVGAVGAKLWYAGTQNIQHVGITNMVIGPSHKLITFPDDRDYYYGHNRITYDMAGVTAACLMVSRKKYEEAGGLDETMAVAYNDVDFCFKLLEAGYYNVQRNDAVLYHHESLSRGLDEGDEDKWKRLLTEKENLYAKHPQMNRHDPFYHRALIDNASDYGCNYKFPYEEHLLTTEAEPLRDKMTGKVNRNRLQLTVDRAEIQHKIHAGEPDILWVMGWCYVPGVNNAYYDKQIMLRREDQEGGGKALSGTVYTAVPANWHREDVEAILPMEQGIGLSGFVLRVLRDDLTPGTYRIGMLCTDTQGNKMLAWSDKTCSV